MRRRFGRRREPSLARERSRGDVRPPASSPRQGRRPAKSGDAVPAENVDAAFSKDPDRLDEAREPLTVMQLAWTRGEEEPDCPAGGGSGLCRDKALARGKGLDLRPDRATTAERGGIRRCVRRASTEREGRPGGPVPVGRVAGATSRSPPPGAVAGGGVEGAPVADGSRPEPATCHGFPSGC